MIQVIVFLFFSFCIAQSPTCGTITDYSITVLNFRQIYGNALLYTFPVRAFSGSFTISGASNNTEGHPDLFDFYILNRTQYQAQSFNWEQFQACPLLDSTCSLNVTCGSLSKTTFSDSETSGNLELFFLCRNSVAPCNIWLNVTLEGIGPDCAPNCPSYDVGNYACNPTCYNAACQYDISDCATASCSSGCPISSYANGVCDQACNNAVCNFDGGDCAPPCATGCTANLIGNGQCNPACNNNACGYDQGDCLQGTASSYISRTTPNPSASPASNSATRGCLF
jgi:hypothetical protein